MPAPIIGCSAAVDGYASQRVRIKIQGVKSQSQPATLPRRRHWQHGYGNHWGGGGGRAAAVVQEKPWSQSTAEESLHDTPQAILISATGARDSYYISRNSTHTLSFFSQSPTAGCSCGIWVARVGYHLPTALHAPGIPVRSMQSNSQRTILHLSPGKFGGQGVPVPGRGSEGDREDAGVGSLVDCTLPLEQCSSHCCLPTTVVRPFLWKTEGGKIPRYF